MTDNWAPCPRCKSNRVQKSSKWVNALAAFGTGSIFFWIGFLLPFLWIAVPIMFILGFLVLFGSSKWLCKDCGYSWKVEKTTSSAAGSGQSHSSD